MVMAEFMSTVSERQPHPEKPKGKPKTFNCPNCAGTITVKAVGHSINAICAYCSSVVDIANENLRIIETANKKTRSTLLAIGSRGTLSGILWEVIGYMEKTDGLGVYFWDEYLLYNPYHGFRFLLQSKGHWSLFKVIKKAFVDIGIATEIKYEGQAYRQFLKDRTIVAYVKGEFYWRAHVGETVQVIDYISPPYMLSVAKNKEEINVSLGEYIESATIAKAFDIEKSAMPYKTGVAANQPSSHGQRAGSIWLTAAVAAISVMVLQLVLSNNTASTTIYENNWVISATDKDKTLSSTDFNLPKQSNVLFTSQSPLNNDWLELSIALVDEQTNTAYETSHALEYYSGDDSEDGSWSEGSQTTDSFLSAVPAGNYRLLIEVDAGAFQKNEPANFSLQVTRGVASWSNCWLTLLALLVYPCYVSFRHRSFENQRWSESDDGRYLIDNDEE
jgi:hypothetical protein